MKIVIVSERRLGLPRLTRFGSWVQDERYEIVECTIDGEKVNAVNAEITTEGGIEAVYGSERRKHVRQEAKLVLYIADEGYRTFKVSDFDGKRHGDILTINIDVEREIDGVGEFERRFRNIANKVPLGVLDDLHKRKRHAVWLPDDLLKIVEKFRKEVLEIFPELYSKDVINSYLEIAEKGKANSYIKMVVCLYKWLGFKREEQDPTDELLDIEMTRRKEEGR